MIITLDQYLGPYKGHPDFTKDREKNAIEWLRRINILLSHLAADGVPLRVNPKTGTLISGDGNGGFRPQLCPVGAKLSNHKEAKSGDLSDPTGIIDIWCLCNEKVLESIGLWLEHPLKTDGWCHAQTVAPGSGRRYYFPG